MASRRACRLLSAQDAAGGVPPGDYIFRCGEIGTSMYFVQQGTLSVMVDDSDAIVLNVLHAVGHFGEISLLYSGHATASARAGLTARSSRRPSSSRAASPTSSRRARRPQPQVRRGVRRRGRLGEDRGRPPQRPEMQGTGTAKDVMTCIKKLGCEKDFPLFCAIHKIAFEGAKPESIVDLTSERGSGFPILAHVPPYPHRPSGPIQPTSRATSLAPCPAAPRSAFDNSLGVGLDVLVDRLQQVVGLLRLPHARRYADCGSFSCALTRTRRIERSLAFWAGAVVGSSGSGS